MTGTEQEQTMETSHHDNLRRPTAHSLARTYLPLNTTICCRLIYPESSFVWTSPLQSVLQASIRASLSPSTRHTDPLDHCRVCVAIGQRYMLDYERRNRIRGGSDWVLAIVPRLRALMLCGPDMAHDSRLLLLWLVYWSHNYTSSVLPLSLPPRLMHTFSPPPNQSSPRRCGVISGQIMIYTVFVGDDKWWIFQLREKRRKNCDIIVSSRNGEAPFKSYLEACIWDLNYCMFITLSWEMVSLISSHASINTCPSISDISSMSVRWQFDCSMLPPPVVSITVCSLHLWRFLLLPNTGNINRQNIIAAH